MHEHRWAQKVYNSKEWSSDSQMALTQFKIFISAHTKEVEVIFVNISVGDYQGIRLLDFGCGPSIHEVISAGAWYKEIHMADYLDRCREQVQNWIDKSPKAFKWTPFFQQYAQLEG